MRLSRTDRGHQQEPEDAAQDPEVKHIGGIEEISIITRSGITAVFLQGRVDGQDPETIVGFDFPPNDAKFLSELKRVQNDPHLFQQLLLFFKVPSAGKKSIETLYVTYNKTIEEA